MLRCVLLDPTVMSGRQYAVAVAVRKSQMTEFQMGPFKVLTHAVSEVTQSSQSIDTWLDFLKQTAVSLFMKDGRLRPVVLALTFPDGTPPIMVTIDLGGVLVSPEGYHLVGAVVPKVLQTVQAVAMLLVTETWIASLETDDVQNAGPVVDRPDKKEAIMFQTEVKGRAPETTLIPILRDAFGKPSLDTAIKTTSMSGQLANFLEPAPLPN